MKAVLGLHALSHDAGAALIAEEKIFAISEERLSRIKYDGGFPDRSIAYVLDAAGIGIGDVDLVVFDHIDRKEPEIIEWLSGKWAFGRRIHAIRHHDAHAASAYFVSPFDDAAVLVVDACGSRAEETETGMPPEPYPAQHPETREVQSFYRGNGGGLTLIRRTWSTPRYPIGIGVLYELASQALGFGELGAGKVMGLAAFGGRKNILPNSIFIYKEGDVLAGGLAGKDPMKPENLAEYSRKFFRTNPRAADGQLTNRHAEAAAYVQRETQEVMVALARHLGSVTGSSNLCLSGGVALNSIANKAVLDDGSFSDVFIQPASTDTGIPLGCALYEYHVVLGEPRFRKMNDVFLGRSYTEKEIEAALENASGIRWSRPENLAGRCAELLADGRVLGWFRGGAELGPRALGHRSILADPRDPAMKDRLNQSVKHREPFRPYAPAALEEKAGDWFEMERPSPFMLYVAKAKAEVLNRIPAVLHVDGTARLQTVGGEADEAFRALVQAFDSLTGVPMILNTSFNDAGEPMVETPEDAIKLFLRTGIDFLALEDFLVEKSSSHFA